MTCEALMTSFLDREASLHRTAARKVRKGNLANDSVFFAKGSGVEDCGGQAACGAQNAVETSRLLGPAIRPLSIERSAGTRLHARCNAGAPHAASALPRCRARERSRSAPGEKAGQWGRRSQG